MGVIDNGIEYPTCDTEVIELLQMALEKAEARAAEEAAARQALEERLRQAEEELARLRDPERA